jgi:PAS domain S-box-containing protein/putative nucleotidyltransferase with HDIG domain
MKEGLLMSSLNDSQKNDAGTKLIRSEEKFNKLFEYSPVGMAMIKHETGEFIEVNQALLQWTGYTKEEFLNLSFWDITPPEYQDQEQQQMVDLESNGRFGPNEKEYIRKDGSKFPIRLKGFMIEDVDGTKLVWGIIEDISNEYRRIFENLQDAYMQFDLSYKLIMVNQGTVKMFGYTTKDEMIGKNLEDLFADHSKINSIKDDLIRRQSLSNCICECVRKDGTSLWISFNVQHIKDNKNNTVSMEGVIRDITERIAADRKIKEESVKLKALIESTDDMVWVVDPVEFGLMTFNHALSHYFKVGRDLNIKKGMRPEDLLPDEYAAEWRRMYGRVLTQGAHKVEYKTSTGNNILELSFYPVKIENELIGISVMGQNITERKQNEINLLATNENLNKIMNNSMFGVVTIGKDKRIRWANPSAVTMMGLKDSADVVGKKCTEYFCPNHEDTCPILDIGETVDNSERKIKRFDGTELSIIKSVTEIEIDGESLLLETFIDITERKKIEIDLMNSKDRFIKAQEMGRFGHWSYNTQTQKFIGSKVTFQIYGFDDLDTVSFDEVINCVSKDDVARVTEKFYKLINDGERFDEQFEIYPKGSENAILIRDIADLYVDKDGVKIIDGVVQDISEFKKLENKVFETSKQNQRILDNLQDSYFQTDLTGVFTLVNPKAAIMYGYQSVEDLIGVKAVELYENAGAFSDMVTKLKTNELLTDYVCKGRRKDNTTFWVSMNVQYVKDASGETVGTEGLVRDISERVDLEEAIKNQRDNLILINKKLAESESKFKTMLETIPAGLFLTGNNHKDIEYLSNYFTEMLGYTLDDLPTLEQWYEKAYPDPQYRKKVLNDTTDNLVKSLNDPAYKTEMKSDVACKDGSVKHILWRGLMLGNQWLGCGFDLSEMSEANLKLAERLHQSVIAISKIGEMRDVYTAGHQRRVQQLSCEIARAIGLPEETIMNISYGALIHDIGKIYIASDILNKPGKISNLEYQIIQTHVEHGYTTVKEIDFPAEIPTMIYQHHERLDGTGYPQGLSGDDIIIESRILAVADVVEAMTSHRPYRPALGIDIALAEIQEFKGTKYDTQVVDICVDLFNTGYTLD